MNSGTRLKGGELLMEEGKSNLFNKLLTEAAELPEVCIVQTTHI